MKGRKKTTDIEKKIKGTDQKCRLNSNEIIINNYELPEPPKWLNKIAKRIYKIKGVELVQTGQLNSQNIELFISMCIELAIYFETSEKILEIPFVAKMNKEASDIYERLVRMNKSAWDKFVRIAIEFGMTPSSRSRIIANLNPVKNENDEFFD